MGQPPFYVTVPFRPLAGQHHYSGQYEYCQFSPPNTGRLFYFLEVFEIYIYPNNLKAKPTLWLWALRDVAVIGVGFVLSVLALAQLGLVPPLIATVLYAFLSIRLEDASILDFLRYAMCFLFLKQQYFEWRENET